ncbi:hypothetical protein CTAYLR_002956 [Chrysophaeum taylorii]|uniref:Uncharacterized protein n=1 Tax=Chrysophaeum taylorii TaxID=2483200 RepID=A0AAD7U5V9_9STRA|nr:hypothetical protein CTAYLR_002956 [Chrysophaeum taylorii]
MSDELRLRFVGVEDLPKDEVLAVAASAGPEELASLAAHLGSAARRFVVDGRVLQGPLKDHGLASTEEVLEVSVIRPRTTSYVAGTPTDDWIGALCAGPVVGSYDGTVVSGNSVLCQHQGAVKAVDAKGDLVASGGHDHLVYIRTDRDTVGEGHGNSVDAISVAPDSTAVASGDWTGMLFLWARQDADKIEPKATHKAHAQCLSGLAWTDETLASCSWDGTIKIWGADRLDLAASSPATGVVLTCLCAPTSHLFVAGAHDSTIRVFDRRDAVVKPRKTKYFATKHAETVSAIAACPTDPNLIASASHDGRAFVWDLRAFEPLHCLEPPTSNQRKLLALAWDRRDNIFLGGDDSTLHHFTVR